MIRKKCRFTKCYFELKVKKKCNVFLPFIHKTIAFWGPENAMI